MKVKKLKYDLDEVLVIALCQIVRAHPGYKLKGAVLEQFGPAALELELEIEPDEELDAAS